MFHDMNINLNFLYIKKVKTDAHPNISNDQILIYNFF